MPTVTQFESASRQPLRVALRISASSPQGPKVRYPFVAPSCCGSLRLLCACFARALGLLPRAPPFRAYLSLHQRASSPPSAPSHNACLPTPPSARLQLCARSGAALVRFCVPALIVRPPPLLCASHAPLSRSSPRSSDRTCQFQCGWCSWHCLLPLLRLSM